MTSSNTKKKDDSGTEHSLKGSQGRPEPDSPVLLHDEASLLLHSKHLYHQQTKLISTLLPLFSLQGLAKFTLQWHVMKLRMLKDPNLGSPESQESKAEFKGAFEKGQPGDASFEELGLQMQPSGAGGP